LFGTAEAQEQTKSCEVSLGGDACVFDVTATADGVLIVDTKAGIDKSRWRASIFRFRMPSSQPDSVASKVGNGTAMFSGAATLRVVSGLKYVVAVTLERPPAPGSPIEAIVRFRGPAVIAGPRANSGFLQFGARWTADESLVLISKDVGPERWDVVWNPADGTLVGNVHLRSGDLAFIACSRTGQTESEVLFSCASAPRCTPSCSPGAWTPIASALPLPISFLEPPIVDDSGGDSPSIRGSE
jgi:hypothetical protein